MYDENRQPNTTNTLNEKFASSNTGNNRLDDKVKKSLKTQFNKMVNESTNAANGEHNTSCSPPKAQNKILQNTLNIKREASTGTQSASKGSHYALLPPLQIKYEAGVLPKIRKKVCRKLYSIFSDKFNYEKKKAKNLAMNFEYKIDKIYDHEGKEAKYIKSLKRLMHYLEGLGVETGERDAEVRKIGKMDPSQFKGLVISLGL